SPIGKWVQSEAVRIQAGRFREFPARKLQRKTIADYLERAVGREGSIRSSIPVAFERVKESARLAAESSEKAATSASAPGSKVDSIQKRVTIAASISAIFLIATLLAIFIQVFSLVSDTQQYTRSSAAEVQKLEKRVEELEKKTNGPPNAAKSLEGSTESPTP